MFRFSLILIIHLLATSFLLGQSIDSNDSKIYSVFLQSEISKTTKSVTIINKLEKDSSSISWVAELIKSRDAQQLDQLRLLTHDDKGNRIGLIDTLTQNLILGFYQYPFKESILTNLVKLKTKIFLINNSPFKKYSITEWQDFYEKYSGSAGLFQFSNIFYSRDGKTAIFYYSVLRNVLNGHGGLTILTNIMGEWKIKYTINLWQA